MNCPPLVFGLPHSCDTLTTFLIYMIPVLAVATVGVSFSVVMLLLMRHDRRAEAAALEATAPTRATQYAIRQARKLARSTEVAVRGAGDRRFGAVKTQLAIGAVLAEVDEIVVEDDEPTVPANKYVGPITIVVPEGDR